MTDAPSTDAERDIRPVVRTATPGNGTLLLGGGAVLLMGLLVFQTLSATRSGVSEPATRPQAGSAAIIAAPPPLALPQDAEPPRLLAPWQMLQQPTAATPPAYQVSFPQQAITRVPARPVAAAAPSLPPAMATSAPFYVPPQPALIERPAVSALSEDAAVGATADRVTASRLQNPALTVPQGMIIPAVLETALDSTRPGAVRAIVSRDVMSFDGSRVLIPRGSRIYGEYAADVSSGQKRALVRWQRLTRPDAVIIQLDSPAADPLGRAGVEGKVDSHFFARFGSAILQSVLDIGVGVATRSVTDDAVILALPGSTQQVAGAQQTAQVQPTLRVRQGTSVSVFVARDLDFSTVDR